MDSAALLTSVWDTPSLVGSNANAYKALDSRGQQLHPIVDAAALHAQRWAGSVVDAHAFPMTPHDKNVHAAGQSVFEAVQWQAAQPGFTTRAGVWDEATTSLGTGVYYIADKKLTTGQVVFARRHHIAEIKAVHSAFSVQYQLASLYGGGGGSSSADAPAVFRRVFTLFDLNLELKLLQDEHYQSTPPSQQAEKRWKTALDCVAEVCISFAGVVTDAVRIPWTNRDHPAIVQFLKSPMAAQRRECDAVWMLQLDRRGLCKAGLLNMFDRCLCPGAPLFAVLREHELDYMTCQSGIYLPQPSDFPDARGVAARVEIPVASVLGAASPVHMVDRSASWLLDSYVYDDVVSDYTATQVSKVHPDRVPFCAHLPRSEAVLPRARCLYWQWTFVSGQQHLQAPYPAQYTTHFPVNAAADGYTVDLAYIEIGYVADSDWTIETRLEDCSADFLHLSDDAGGLASQSARNTLIRRARALRWRYAVQVPPVILQRSFISAWLNPASIKVASLQFGPLMRLSDSGPEASPLQAAPRDRQPQAQIERGKEASEPAAKRRKLGETDGAVVPPPPPFRNGVQRDEERIETTDPVPQVPGSEDSSTPVPQPQQQQQQPSDSLPLPTEPPEALRVAQTQPTTMPATPGSTLLARILARRQSTEQPTLPPRSGPAAGAASKK